MNIDIGDDDDVDNMFVCNRCDLQLMSHELLKLHKQNCLFNNNNNNNSGMDKQKERPVDCDQCDRRLINHLGLAIHKSRMHKKPKKPAPPKKPVQQEEEFACAHCGQKFKKKQIRTIHQKKCLHAPAAPPPQKQQQREIKKEIMPKSTSGGGSGPPKKRVLQQQSMNSTGNSNRSSYQQSSSMGSSSRARSCFGHRHQQDSGEEETEDDEIAVLPATHNNLSRKTPAPTKSVAAGRPRQLVPRNSQNQQEDSSGFGAGSAVISHYAGMVINACSQSNLVTFHNVDTARGTIGKITFQFMCNECRGERGIARCARGRPYCIRCCGHRECDD